MYETVIYFTIYVLGCLTVIILSLANKVKGKLWVILYIVLGTAMIWLRLILPQVISSIIDSALFLVLLLWIVVINKLNTRRKKEQ